MSELEKKTEEAPKRKRRTKAEIEAARAAGEVPAKRTKKKVTEAPKVEEQAPKEEKYQRPTLPKEQSVLIMSCLNPVVAKLATEAARQNGVEVVILEDKVLYDYLDAKGEAVGMSSLGNFLNDTTNRLQSERNSIALWQILTGGAPLETAPERIFTRTQLVKMTNLTHSKAQNALNSLRIFGMLEYTKGEHEFRLIFDKKRIHKTIETEVVAMCKQINTDIMRFKASIDSDEDLTKEERDKMYYDLQEAINATIEF